MEVGLSWRGSGAHSLGCGHGFITQTSSAALGFRNGGGLFRNGYLSLPEDVARVLELGLSAHGWAWLA
jgi:hypothetical protein